MSVTTEKSGAAAFRPFHVEISDEALEDLHQRVMGVRWPSKELVTDRSQGVQLATIQVLARYWATDYDWRKCEARLNTLPTVQDRDRRGGHPLHSRQVGARERVAVHHDPRLARLCDRAARDRRPAYGPDGARGRAEDAFDLQEEEK